MRIAGIAVAFVFAVLVNCPLATALPTLPRDTPNLDLHTSGDVYCMAQQADGKLLVGGAFVEANGQSANSLVRFNADGSVDTGWTPSVQTPVVAMSVSQDGNVYALTWTNGNGWLLKIPLAGNGAADPAFLVSDFSIWASAVVADDAGHVYVAPVNSQIARYDAHTGARDTSWHSPANGNNLALDHAGHMYVNVERINVADGNPDVSWTPPQLNGVGTVVLGSDGYLYVSGFTQLGTTSIRELARFPVNGYGAVDASWQPDPQSNTSQPQIDAMLPLADGSVLVAGLFDRVGGQPQTNLARLTGAQGQADRQWTTSSDGVVTSLVVAASGSIYAGGSYAMIGGAPAASVARLLAAGNRDTGFDAGVFAGGVVAAIAYDPSSGHTYIGGRFDWAGGAVHHNILRVASDGSLDPDWIPATDSVQTAPLSIGGVKAIAISASGDVYLGGGFARVNGIPRHDLAKLINSPAGAIDPAWSPSPAGSSSSFPDGTSINALAVDNHGRVIVGGDFKSIGGVTQEMIARVDAAGAVDTGWRPDPVDPIERLAYDGNDGLYFVFNDTYNSTSKIGKLSVSSGTFDYAWDSTMNGYQYVSDIVFARPGWLYLANPSPWLPPTDQLLRVSPSTGGVDAVWHPQVDCSVMRLAPDTAGAFVYASGQHVLGGGFSPPSQACAYRITAAGDVDTSFAPIWTTGSNDGIWAAAVGSGGTAYLGGFFSNVSGVGRSALAGFDGPDKIFTDGFDP